MDNAGKFITTTFAVLAVFSGCIDCQDISQGPRNSTVLQGTQAKFNCTVTGEWKTITWFHFNRQVMLIDRNVGIMNNASRFSALSYTVPDGFISELILSDVRLNDTGLIACNAFSTDNYNAYLSVQVNGTVRITTTSLTVTVNETVHIVCQASGWLPDPQITWTLNASFVDPINYSTLWSDGTAVLKNAVSTLNMSFAENETVTCLASIETIPKPQSATVSLRVVEKPVEVNKSIDNTAVILIAVFATVGGLLLIALIVLIVICCRRRRKKKESSYQSQMKKVSAQKTINVSTISKNVAGSANIGYDEDPSSYRRALPKVPSEDSNSLGSLEAEQRFDKNHAFEAQRTYNKPQYPQYLENSAHLSRAAQVRHLTHV